MTDYETAAEGAASLRDAAIFVCGKLRPPPTLTVDQWAQEYRQLSPEASAEPGQWHNERAPYLVEPMRALSPLDPAQWVICKFPSQDGKTEILLNFIGYIIDQDPGPVLITQPNVKPMAESFSKDRLAPMLRDTPRLQGKVKEARSRDSGNTIFHKQFAGGHATVNGANSPAGLASRPIRYFIGDEINRWPASAGTEGSPLGLAEKRTRRFWNRKLVLTSSPTFEGIGISAQYARSDCSEWQLQCAHCGEYQFPRLRHLVAKRRPDDPADLQPGDVVYACEHCGGEHTHQDEHAVKRSGQWVCTKPERGSEVRGFWKSGLSSMFTTWHEVLREFFMVKDDPADLQVFTNTVLAEDWIGAAEAIDESVLYQRRGLSAEHYDAAVPAFVELLVAGVDVQADRLELEIVGYAADRTTAGIMYRVLWGDTSEADVWQQLDEALGERFEKADGAVMTIEAACIDSGYNTQTVYDFVRPRMGRRIIATKGKAGGGMPIISAPVKQKTARGKAKTPVFTIAVDLVKALIFERLKKSDPAQPGYCHFPQEYTETYFTGLTSEHLVRRVVRGETRLSWEKRNASIRNEPLDCRVLAEAALWFLNPKWLRTPAPAVKRKKAPKKKPQARTVARQITDSHRRTVTGAKRKARGGFVKRY